MTQTTPWPCQASPKTPSVKNSLYPPLELELTENLTNSLSLGPLEHTTQTPSLYTMEKNLDSSQEPIHGQTLSQTDGSREPKLEQ